VLNDRLDTSTLFASDIKYSAYKEGTAAGDVMTGTSGTDRLFGLGGNDQINGGAGNDLLLGGAGNDTINGGSGNDMVLGGTGDDRLTGGTGNDILSGGTGSDVFDFATGISGKDSITDFNAFANEHDVLVFSRALFQTVDQVLSDFDQIGNDAVLAVGTGSVILQDFNVANLHADQFMLV
jgi:Ca2+-binding RTX toxin-like protein